MNTRPGLIAVLLCLFTASTAAGAPFVTFPEQKELASPDGRYRLRSIDPPRQPGSLTSVFHSLVLEDRATGTSRRLYDYLYKISVAWSGDRIIATEYLSRRGSRALVFSVDPKADTFVIDRIALADRVPIEVGGRLRWNDHVFVEAVHLDGKMLQLRAWGYGAHDRSGFRLACELDLEQAIASCQDGSRFPSQP